MILLVTRSLKQLCKLNKSCLNSQQSLDRRTRKIKKKKPSDNDQSLLIFQNFQKTKGSNLGALQAQPDTTAAH